MPRKRTKQVRCRFFAWRLFQRDGVWYADGRGEHNLGKHSLATRDRQQALSSLEHLDHALALSRNLTSDPIDTNGTDETVVPIGVGWKDYLEHCGRPDVLGGVSKNTLKRYRAVRDKHVKFCGESGIATWNDVDKTACQKYGRMLHRRHYADRSVYLELTLIRSVVGWLIEEDRLPAGHRFRLQLRRPQGTNTYCYSREEVTAMVAHCRASSKLNWLADVITALACTGLRIGELASLRQSDIELDNNLIRLKDERGQGRNLQACEKRTTKGRRGRTLPIHPELRTVIEKQKKHTDGRLLHGPRGGKLKPSTVRNILIRDVITPLKEKFPGTNGDVTFEHGRVHSFRHYFVSQAFLCGATEGEVMEWVGHRDSKMVAHYRHLRNEESQRKMRQINFLKAEEDTPDDE